MLGHKVTMFLIFWKGIIVCSNGIKYLGENIAFVLFLDIFEIRNYE